MDDIYNYDEDNFYEEESLTDDQKSSSKQTDLSSTLTKKPVAKPKLIKKSKPRANTAKARVSVNNVQSEVRADFHKKCFDMDNQPKLPKKALNIESQLVSSHMQGQRVIARHYADGFFYPGKIAEKISKDDVRIKYDFQIFSQEVVPVAYCLETGGATSRPFLYPNDLVLCGVRNACTGLICYVPGMISGKSEDDERVYNIRTFNGRRVSAVRSQIVKINPERYRATVEYIKKVAVSSEDNTAVRENKCVEDGPCPEKCHPVDGSISATTTSTSKKNKTLLVSYRNMYTRHTLQAHHKRVLDMRARSAGSRLSHSLDQLPPANAKIAPVLPWTKYTHPYGTHNPRKTSGKGSAGGQTCEIHCRQYCTSRECLSKAELEAILSKQAQLYEDVLDKVAHHTCVKPTVDNQYRTYEVKLPAKTKVELWLDKVNRDKEDCIIDALFQFDDDGWFYRGKFDPTTNTFTDSLKKKYDLGSEIIKTKKHKKGTKDEDIYSLKERIIPLDYPPLKATEEWYHFVNKLKEKQTVLACHPDFKHSYAPAIIWQDAYPPDADQSEEQLAERGRGDAPMAMRVDVLFHGGPLHTLTIVVWRYFSTEANRHLNATGDRVTGSGGRNARPIPKLIPIDEGLWKKAAALWMARQHPPAPPPPPMAAPPPPAVAKVDIASNTDKMPDMIEDRLVVFRNPDWPFYQLGKLVAQNNGHYTENGGNEIETVNGKLAHTLLVSPLSKCCCLPGHEHGPVYQVLSCHVFQLTIYAADSPLVQYPTLNVDDYVLVPRDIVNKTKVGLDDLSDRIFDIRRLTVEQDVNLLNGIGVKFNSAVRYSNSFVSVKCPLSAFCPVVSESYAAAFVDWAKPKLTQLANTNPTLGRILTMSYQGVSSSTSAGMSKTSEYSNEPDKLLKTIWQAALEFDTTKSGRQSELRQVTGFVHDRKFAGEKQEKHVKIVSPKSESHQKIEHSSSATKISTTTIERRKVVTSESTTAVAGDYTSSSHVTTVSGKVGSAAPITKRRASSSSEDSTGISSSEYSSETETETNTESRQDAKPKAK